MNKGPLAGIKVVEICGLGPGPCAGMMLADMGAEVVLVERKAALTNDDASKYLIFNRGKKSIAVDLKNPDGVELVLRLVENADVLIEGFRPGVMERLGLGPEVCLERNPKLVYGRMTGWGQTGPLAQAAGHDSNYISVSGAFWYGGRREQAPTAPLTLVGDLGGGTMMLAWGILCAVIHAGKTGEGQVIDAAITDGSAYISTLLWTWYNAGQIKDQLETGWVDGAAPWNGTYRCADGKYVNVCALEPQFYQELIERLELTENTTFTNQWESDLWLQGKKELKALFLTKNREQWCELLEGTDVCFAPVLDFSEAPRHPHNIARNTFLNIDEIIQPAPAPKFSHSKPAAGIPPKTGEHTAEILGEIGMSEKEILEFEFKGVI